MKRLFSRLSISLAAFAFAAASFAATTVPVQLLNPTGSTSGQTIVSNGATSAPGWATVPLSGLSSIAANTVLANTTASSATPAAFSMPSCSTSASALNWTTSTGFTCNTAVNAATLGGATFASPGPIGSTTAGTGAFTTLSASSTVSGAGFSTYLASPPAIGGTAAAPGSFTTLSASSTVSGSGFSTYLASPPAIGGTTAAAGKFTTLQATGLITPASAIGIAGTTTNDNAQAGSLGEYASNTTSATSLSTGVTANATSVSLTAGDWFVQCSARFNPAATTTVSVIFTSVNTTSATNGGLGASVLTVATLATGQQQIITTPVVRVSLASSGTAYCPSYSSFGTSTMTVDGFIEAWRRR